MEWNQLLSSKRLGEKSEKSPTNNRSPFESDIDRIIFSGSFRRLSRKTQVHPLAPNDHVHTRLTHSLEVAQVGKALGKKLGIEIKDKLPKNFSPDDMANIVQAACLAHDLGNPPFGHAGESAITHWFEVNSQQLFRSLDKHIKKDLSVFEGNAQGFRILTQTENHLFDGGLRLTYACLGTFLKYPWSSRISKDKFGAYITEENILTSVAKELGLIKKGEHEWCRHPLAYLVEAADDICYAVLDLEDAVELGILKFDQVSSLLLEMFDVNEQNIIKKNFGPENAFRVNLARIRSPVFDKVASEAILSFMSNYDKIMAGSFNSELFQEDGNGAIILKAKKMARKNIFKDQKKVEIELGCYSTFECLLKSFCEAALDCSLNLKGPQEEVKLAWKSNLVLNLLADHAPNEKNSPPGNGWSKYQCLRRVLDYVSGMTDNYAIYIAKQLQGMGFSGVQRP